MKKILLIIFFISLASNLFAGNITVTSGSLDNLKVTDGDTIVINGKKIRFSGIDTPEINQTCIKNFKIEECGIIAKNLLIKKIGQSKVECVEEGKDYFNRVLAECFIEDESLSKYLVRNGYAFAFKKYSKKFIEDENFAKINNLGIWATTFQYPWEYRKTIKYLNKGGNLIFIRHSLAPGNGDPSNFEIDECSTQRNLNNNGIAQSKIIGSFFKKNRIKFGEILSSEWCRCKDTAKLAFKSFKTFDALNSFYDAKFADNKSKQLEDLQKYINQWDGKKNLVFVTHFVVISSILNKGSASGEILITDRNFNLLATIETM